MRPQHSHSLRLDPGYLRKLFQSGTRKDYVAGVRLALRQVLASMHVEEHYDTVVAQVKREACYRDLNNTWEQLAPPVRVQKWQELMEHVHENFHLENSSAYQAQARQNWRLLRYPGFGILICHFQVLPQQRLRYFYV